MLRSRDRGGACWQREQARSLAAPPGQRLGCRCGAEDRCGLTGGGGSGLGRVGTRLAGGALGGAWLADSAVFAAPASASASPASDLSLPRPDFLEGFAGLGGFGGALIHSPPVVSAP